MENILRQQLNVLKSLESIAKQDRLLQAAQLYEGSKIKADDDILVEKLGQLNDTMDQVANALSSKTGDSINSQIINLGKSIKQSSVNLNSILTQELSRTKTPTGISDTIRAGADKVKDFFSIRGFLDQTGIAKRGGDSSLSRRADAREEQSKVAQARIDAGELARDERGRFISRPKSFEVFKEQEAKAQDLRARAEKIKEQIRDRYEGRITKSGIDNTKLSKELQDITKQLVKLRGEWAEDNDSDDKTSEKQTEYLRKIEKNLSRDETLRVPVPLSNAPDGRLPNAPSAPAVSGGGGGWDKFLGGVTRGINTLADALKAIGKGLGNLVGGFFQGLMTGIANGIKAFANPKVFLGVAAMAGIAGAIWVVSDAFQKFAKVEWDDVLKGFTALAGLGVVAAVMGAAAPVLLTGAAVIGALGIALIPVALGLTLASSAIDSFADSLAKLSALDVSGLSRIGPALMSVAAGLVAFSAASVAGGISNLVSGLFSVISGQDTPIDQLQKMSTYGAGLQTAGTGIKSIADGMVQFNKIDSEAMEKVNNFPWLKATLFAKAGGQLQITGPTGGVIVGDVSDKAEAFAPQPDAADTIYGKSAEIKQAEMIPMTTGGNNIVNAPTTITKTTQNTIARPNARNNESAVSRFIGARFAPATI